MDRDLDSRQPAATAAPRDQRQRSAPDGDPHWRVTLPVMWVAQLCSIMGFSFVMPFIPFFVRELGVSEQMVPVWAGLTVTGSGISMSIMAPVWGYLADRRGRKLMVQRAMFGGSIVLALIGMSRNVYELLGLRVAQGAVTGTVPACVALVASVVPKDRLGFSLGLMQMAVFMGGSVGPYLGGTVADRFGYRVPFGVTAALLLTGGFLVLFGAKERFTPSESAREAHTALRRGLLQDRSVLGLLGVFFIMNFSASFAGPIFPLFVEQIVGGRHSAASETGILLGITGVAGAAAAVAIGRLSDRLGHRRLLIVCTALTGAFTAPHFFAQTMGQLVLLRLLFGFAAGGMMPAMNALVANVVPRSRIGQAYGFTTTASALGWATGPALGGVAAALIGYRWPFAIMGALLLLAALAQRRWVPPAGSDDELPTEEA